MNKPLVIALAAVAVLIVIIIGFLVGGGEEEPAPVQETVEIPEPEPAPPPPEPEPEPEPVPEPVVEEPEPDPEPAFVLPRLEDSDPLVRDGVVSLTRHEGINRWLGTSDLIRKSVVVADNVANGSIPRQQVSFLAPADPFKVRQVGDGVYAMDPASYDRYDRMTDIFASIDAQRAAEFYELLQPLFQSAYDELGYPDGEIDTVILQAIGRLLETPVLDQPPELVQPVVMYEYRDPRLENLSGAQKQLLRMGPDNTRRIQDKLRELASALRSVMD